MYNQHQRLPACFSGQLASYHDFDAEHRNDGRRTCKKLEKCERDCLGFVFPDAYLFFPLTQGIQLMKSAFLGIPAGNPSLSIAVMPLQNAKIGRLHKTTDFSCLQYPILPKIRQNHLNEAPQEFETIENDDNAAHDVDNAKCFVVELGTEKRNNS